MVELLAPKTVSSLVSQYEQFRNLIKGMGIESNKTSFKGGYEMSLPDSSNIQEPEDAQDAHLKKGAFVE